jgi:sugar O-acyltransferase (sialic acid O-acetyltransferase NeuD family)
MSQCPNLPEQNQMTKEKIIIIGAGDHAKAVIDTASLLSKNIIGLLDDNKELLGKELLGVPVLGSINEIDKYKEFYLISGIGNNIVRKSIALQLKNYKWTSLIHPSAYVAKHSQIGMGTVVFAHAVIQPHVVIGNHCIINMTTSLSHDCIIEDYVHTAPGCRLTGHVKIGEGTFLGAATVVIPNIKIGKWSTIGAGATVINNIPSNVVAVGSPAKVIKSKEVN